MWEWGLWFTLGMVCVLGEWEGGEIHISSLT